jgi:hypothetical protein
MARSTQGLERPGTLVSILGLMRLTAEIRWFWPDRPPGIPCLVCRRWCSLGAVGASKTRVDEYLRDPDQDSLGIKKSGGGDVEGLISR